MREYVLSLKYSPNVHPVADVFINHPEILSSTLTISASPQGGWRIERMTGPERALDALEEIYTNPDVCNDCAYPNPACDAEFEYQVLENTPTARTIYKYVTDVSYCHSVSYLAIETLGSGLVFDATRRGPVYEWRLLVPDEKNIEAFHEALREDLPEGVTLDVNRIGGPEGWQRPQRTKYDLPYEQRKVLETALQEGYYHHPRDATLETLATVLDTPVTTLRYRLRRAEAWAVETALGDKFETNYR